MSKVYFHDENGELLPGSYPAKQSFKDQCDINRILDKAKRTGTLSHIAAYQQHYSDFAGFDYEEALIKTAEAKSMFYDLPAEVRKEFANNPGAFLSFVQNNTPEAIREKLPQLAEPGRQLPDVIGGGTPPSAPGASPGASGAAPRAAPPAAPETSS